MEKESAVQRSVRPSTTPPDKPPMDTMQQVDSLRRHIGGAVSSLSSNIDDNLMLFRWGCFATMIGCAYISIRSSGLLTRYTSVDALPVGVPITARVLGQSAKDPSTLYVYHTPWIRRVLFKETLPRSFEVSGLLTDKSSLLAVRPYGVDMQDDAKRWLYLDFVAARRYVTVELLYRPPVNPDHDDQESVATTGAACAISTPKNIFFNSDMAETAVSRGIAKCREEPEFDWAKPNMRCVVIVVTVVTVVTVVFVVQRPLHPAPRKAN
ncbi:Aste57867_10375 [Aphanomyces stellatus]|uniref:Aste57867_10375 protein n=1 Tax=Aphanomyces stellatus TaxID=120398 RepID=A0A485KQ66_9STRA|nr:hypothetical protein As57867_010335 [Aphanomyces stellatus]VFT87249.1 Aste57867_10375 [Aphanomyces stellatus]